MGFESYVASKEGILPFTYIRSGLRRKGGRRNFQKIEPGTRKNNGKQESFSQKADPGSGNFPHTPGQGFSKAFPFICNFFTYQ